MRQSIRVTQEAPKDSYSNFSKGIEWNQHAKETNNPRVQLIKNMEIDSDGKLSVRRPMIPLKLNGDDWSAEYFIEDDEKVIQVIHAPFKGAYVPYIWIIEKDMSTSDTPDIKQFVRYFFGTKLIDDPDSYSYLSGVHGEVPALFLADRDSVMLNTINGIVILKHNKDSKMSSELISYYQPTLSELSETGINLYNLKPYFLVNEIVPEGPSKIIIEGFHPYLTETSGTKELFTSATFKYDTAPSVTDTIVEKMHLRVPQNIIEQELGKFFTYDATSKAIVWIQPALAALKTLSKYAQAIVDGGAGTAPNNEFTNIMPAFKITEKVISSGSEQQVKPATVNTGIKMPVLATFLGSDSAQDELTSIFAKLKPTWFPVVNGAPSDTLFDINSLFDEISTRDSSGQVTSRAYDIDKRWDLYKLPAGTGGDSIFTLDIIYATGMAVAKLTEKIVSVSDLSGGTTGTDGLMMISPANSSFGTNPVVVEALSPFSNKIVAVGGGTYPTRIRLNLNTSVSPYAGVFMSTIENSDELHGQILDNHLTFTTIPGDYTISHGTGHLDMGIASPGLTSKGYDLPDNTFFETTYTDIKKSDSPAGLVLVYFTTGEIGVMGGPNDGTIYSNEAALPPYVKRSIGGVGSAISTGNGIKTIIRTAGTKAIGTISNFWDSTSGFTPQAIETGLGQGAVKDLNWVGDYPTSTTLTTSARAVGHVTLFPNTFFADSTGKARVMNNIDFVVGWNNTMVAQFKIFTTNGDVVRDESIGRGLIDRISFIKSETSSFTASEAQYPGVKYLDISTDNIPDFEWDFRSAKYIINYWGQIGYYGYSPDLVKYLPTNYLSLSEINNPAYIPATKLIDVFTSNNSDITKVLPWKDNLVLFTDESTSLAMGRIPEKKVLVHSTVGVPEAYRETTQIISDSVIFKNKYSVFALVPTPGTDGATSLRTRDIAEQIKPYLLEIEEQAPNYIKSTTYNNKEYWLIYGFDDKTVIFRYDWSKYAWTVLEIETKLTNFVKTAEQEIVAVDTYGRLYELLSLDYQLFINSQINMATYLRNLIATSEDTDYVRQLIDEFAEFITEYIVEQDGITIMPLKGIYQDFFFHRKPTSFTVTDDRYTKVYSATAMPKPIPYEFRLGTRRPMMDTGTALDDTTIIMGNEGNTPVLSQNFSVIVDGHKLQDYQVDLSANASAITAASPQVKWSFGTSNYSNTLTKHTKKVRKVANTIDLHIKGSTYNKIFLDSILFRYRQSGRKSYSR